MDIDLSKRVKMTQKEIDKLRLEQLKEAARIFLKPMEKLPFPVVLEAMTGYSILPVVDRPKDWNLLGILSRACIDVVANSKNTVIPANRPNDVSAKVEELLGYELTKNGARVEKPKALKGRSPGGYPDRIVWIDNEPTYLEIKVSREENIDKGSARNFFYQPTVNTKIKYSTRHLLTGFAIRETSEKKWGLTKWKIVDLWFLKVKLKPEYNADNVEIYRPESILMEGNGTTVLRRKANI